MYDRNKNPPVLLFDNQSFTISTLYKNIVNRLKIKKGEAL